MIADDSTASPIPKATTTNALAQLAQAMEAHGLPCDSMSDTPGYHRYTCRGTNDRHEWYEIFYVSGHLEAFFGTWRACGPFKIEYHSDPNLLTDEKYLVEYRKKTEQIEKENEERAKQNIAVWKDRLNKTDDAKPDHPYLKRKQVKTHGIKQFGEWLEIPIYDCDGELISVQKIGSNGEKSFASGCKTKRGRYYLGDPIKSNRIYVAEGFATGSSVYETLDEKECVAIAFWDRNCVPVGVELQLQFPGKELILCQDLGKAGEAVAKNWRELINKSVKEPDFKGKGTVVDKDWNDLACHVGLGKEEAKKQLEFVFSYKPMCINKFMEIKREPIVFCVEEMFRKCSTNIIYGSSGSGKSILLYDLGGCLSTGLPFFGLKTIKGRVLYVDAEMPENLIEYRLNHLFKRFPEGCEFDPGYFDILSREKIFEQGNKAINLHDEKSRNEMSKTIEPYDYIILDSISFISTRAGTPIKDYQQEETSWEFIRDWALNHCKNGKTIFYVSHTLKNSEIMKGSSIIPHPAETIIRMDRVPNPNDKKMGIKNVVEAIDPEFNWPSKLEYEKNRNARDWNKLPTVIALVKDPTSKQMSSVYANNGWKVEA